MTKEEAKSFLIDISYKFGNMGVEYLTEKDGEKMREAIEVLGQATAAKDITTDMSIQLMLERKAIEKDLEQKPIDMDMTKALILGLLLGIDKNPDEKDKLREDLIKVFAPEQKEWTPVSEGLPEKSTWVLVTCKNPDGYIFLDIKLINRYTELWDGDEDFIGTVLAWMPLPEPYKEEDRGGLEK